MSVCGGRAADKAHAAYDRSRSQGPLTIDVHKLFTASRRALSETRFIIVHIGAGRRAIALAKHAALFVTRSLTRLLGDEKLHGLPARRKA